MHSWSQPLLYELKDFRKFLRLCQVFDKNAGRLVPFVPTAVQLRLADCLLENKRVIILKARQIGASTIIRAYFTWKALISAEPLRLGIMSYTHESAAYLHSLDRSFVDSLPASMKRKLDSATARTIKFKDTGAELRSFTAGMKGGGTRSYALSDLHLSEFAHYDDQEEVLSNAVSTVGEGGQIVIETTANGPGDKYHQLVTESGENGWTLFWSPWFEHAAYSKQARFGLNNVTHMTQDERRLKSKWNLSSDQMYWRRTMIHTMGLDKFTQEYPATPEEAFTATSKSYLQPKHLEGVEIKGGPASGPSKEIYLVPVEGFDTRPLALGVDVAAGNGHDYSCITAVDVEIGQPVFHYYCNDESPSRISERLMGMCEKWNVKSVLVESNGMGGIVLQRLRDFGLDKHLLWKNEDGNDWTTNKWSKIRALEELRGRLEDGTIKVMWRGLADELALLVVGQKGTAPRAAKGHHDDIVISTSLAFIATLGIPSIANRSLKIDMMNRWKTQCRIDKRRSQPLPWKVANL